MNYAREAYEVYCRHTGWKSLASGQPLPQWDDLPEAIRKAWEVSSAWLLGLFAGQGVHEHRLHAEIERLEKEVNTLSLRLADLRQEIDNGIVA